MVLSPFLYYMLRPHTSPLHATLFVGPTDPIAFFVPGSLLAGGAWQASRWASLGLPATHDTFAYLGLPLLVIAVAYAIGERRLRSARLLTICFAVGLVAVMGTRLVIAGHDTGLALPWALLTHIPLLGTRCRFGPRCTRPSGGSHPGLVAGDAAARAAVGCVAARHRRSDP